MSWIENLLIIAGISLDIFGAVECQGSLVRKIDKKQLALISGLVALWQLCALFVGYYFSNLLCRYSESGNEVLMSQVIAIIIFAGLGIRLMVKAIRNTRIEERCENQLEIKRFVRMVALTSIYTILAGAAFAFLEIDFIALLIFIVIFSIVVVIAGMYTGYHFGFEHKKKAYILGAVFLWIAGADVLIRCILSFQ